MKKVLSVLLVAVLCCGLVVGCGKKERKQAKDFASEDLVTHTYFDIEYKTPESRKEMESTNIEKFFFFNEDKTIITINYIGWTEDRDSLEEKKLEDVSSQSENCSKIESSAIDIEGKTYKKYSYSYGDNICEAFVIIECDGGYAKFTIHEEDVDTTYMNDFTNMCESITHTETHSAAPDTEVSKKEKTEEQLQGEAETMAKDQRYNQKSSNINDTLDKLKSDKKYSDLIKDWSASAHSLDNSCDISVEFQASADVRVGTVSAIRNKLSDIVLEELPEIKEISINFKGIGTYVFTVGTGWDKEVKADDNE